MKSPTLAAAALLLIALGSGAKAVAAVAPEVQQRMRAVTFEVVRLKPEEGAVQYEKPLPLELLPYAERTDKYQSIGTAFSLGRNTFVTAAHVLVACLGSQFGPPVLRSADGKVHAVDRILKFSLHEDFAEFSLVDDPGSPTLEINRSPRLDDTVVAVGNALGEGVVIREGLFTSETPEAQDGRWKWIRFSAAASPGNSGGPLLDGNGRVIGIVIGKSENENLNYSLPIARVLDAADNTAVLEERLVNTLPFLHGSQTFSYSEKFKLPLKWQEFANNYLDAIARQNDRARAELLAAYANRSFPNGPGTESVFFESRPSYRPRLISQQADDTWLATEPSFKRIDLPGDGYVNVGPISTGMMIRLHRSNDASDDGFYSDSKGFMEIAIKGLNITRQVGPDEVRVTSLGKATVDQVHVDQYGRRWQYRVWPLPYLDIYVIGLLLPTPDGYVGLVQYALSVSLRENTARVKLLADHADVSYWGSLDQWRAYLGRRALLPETLKGVKLEFQPEGRLTTDRFQFGVPEQVFKTNGRSELGLALNFIRGDKKVEWNATGAWLYRDEQQKAFAGIWRQPLPPQEAKRETRNRFANMRDRKSPYDGIPTRESSDTYSVSTVIDAPGRNSKAISSGVVYGLVLQLDGSASATRIDSGRLALIERVKILERGIGDDVEPSPREASSTDESASWAPELERFAEIFYRATNDLGPDIRGRTIAQDFEEFFLGRTPSAQVLNQKADVISWLRDFASKAVRTDELLTLDALGAYWTVAPQAAYNDRVWSEFLKRNGLPLITSHGEEFSTARANLLRTLASRPTSDWKRQAEAFVAAASKERRETMARVDLDRTIVYSPRKTACPAPVKKTSGKPHVLFVGNLVGLESLYPERSKAVGEEGEVIVSMRVSPTGCALSTGIAGSSGSELLDDAGLVWAETAELLPAEKEGKPIEATFKAKITFRLAQ